MKLIALIFLIQIYFIIVSKYVFSNTKEFINQLNNASIDELIYILSHLEKFNNVELLYLERMYSKGREKLLLLISKIMDKKEIDSEILSTEVLKDHLKRTAKEEIEKSEWYQKVAWVINADLYYLKMEMRKPQLSGIIDYVNYLSNDQLDKYLYDLLEKIPAFKDDYSLFESEIINRKPLPENLINYLENQKITTLNEWGVRIYLYMKQIDKHDNQPKCNEIEDLFNIANPQKAFLYINKYLSNFNTKKDYDKFFKHIVYNNHSFPLLKDTLDTKPIEEIRQISKYVESYHRRATKNPKSFEHLNEYINQIQKYNLIGYILSESKVYPELNEENRAKDFHNMQNMASLSNVNNLLMKKDRVVIIRWALNIHDYFYSQSQKDISSISEYIYSQTTERILEELINYLKNKTVDYSIYDISKLDDPQNSTEEFKLLLQSHPSVIQKKWLIKLQEFHQNFANSRDSSVDLQNSVDINDFLIRYINLYKIDREKFRSIIDDRNDRYTIPYGNYATYFYSIQTTELIVWLRKLEDYIRSKRKYGTIIGGLKSFDNSDIQSLNKTVIIKQLLTYIELFPELKDIKTFDEVIGMYRIHSKIHNSDLESLRQYAKALRKYHDIKLIQYNTSESNEKAMTEFLKVADECHIKLYIFRIIAILPELNIDSVWNTVIELGNDLLVEKFDQIGFLIYLSKLDKEKLVYYCKQCSRYTNSLKKVYIPDDCSSKNKSSLLWNITSTVFSSDNDILQFNINFFRLTMGSEEMIYGGLEPFINRQPNEHLDIIIKSLPIIAFINESIDKDAVLNNADRNEKIECIMNIIYQNKLTDLKQFDNYLDTSELNKELFQLNKDKLRKYALVGEHYLANQKNKNPMNMDSYDIVSDKYMQMTKNELIRFILRINMSIDDLEVKSRMVLLTIGEINYGNFFR